MTALPPPVIGPLSTLNGGSVTTSRLHHGRAGRATRKAGRTTLAAFGMFGAMDASALIGPTNSRYARCVTSHLLTSSLTPIIIRLPGRPAAHGPVFGPACGKG